MSHLHRICIVIALATMLALPSEAAAWTTNGPPYPSGTVRYWVAPMPAHAKASVAQAVRGWNSAGARVRLVASTRALAKIRVQTPRSSGCRGFATYTAAGTRRGVSSVTWSLCPDRTRNAVIMAHEMGHALGLGHEDRRCSIMTTLSESGGAPVRCVNGSIRPWQYYCRMLELDDARGLVARYGGTVRLPTGPRLCSRGPAPAALENVTLGDLQPGFLGFSTVTASWTNPAGSSARSVAVLWLVGGGCPTSFEDPNRNEVDQLDAVVGAASTTFERAGTSPLCIFAQAYDRFGQPGPASVVSRDYST